MATVVYAATPTRVHEAEVPAPTATPSEVISPKEYLKIQAGANYDLINRIIIAESGWKPNAKNPKSTASGLLQYLDSTFKHYCIGGVDKYGKAYGYALTDTMADKNDPYIQIDCAILMINDGGLSHWNESRYIWQR